MGTKQAWLNNAELDEVASRPNSSPPGYARAVGSPSRAPHQPRKPLAKAPATRMARISYSIAAGKRCVTDASNGYGSGDTQFGIMQQLDSRTASPSIPVHRRLRSYDTHDMQILIQAACSVRTVCAQRTVEVVLGAGNISSRIYFDACIHQLASQLWHCHLGERRQQLHDCGKGEHLQTDITELCISSQLHNLKCSVV